MRTGRVLAIVAIAAACSKSRERPSITRTDDEPREIVDPPKEDDDDGDLTTFEKPHFVIRLPSAWHEDPPFASSPSMATYTFRTGDGGGEQIVAYVMDMSASPSVYAVLTRTYGVDLAKDWSRKSFDDALHIKMPAEYARGVFIGGHGILMTFVHTTSSGKLADATLLDRVEPR